VLDFVEQAALVGPVEPVAPVVDPYKTGSPGRPTISHLIEAEYNRRQVAGETNAELKDEAAALHGWAEISHPMARTPTVTTIQNQIRSAHRAFRESQPKPTKSPTK